MMDDGTSGTDLIDAWDAAGLANLVASLVECIALISRRPCEDGEAER